MAPPANLPAPAAPGSGAGRAIFGDGCPPDAGCRWRGTFTTPRALLRAVHLHEVQEVVRQADAAARDGQWAVLALAYEAAPAFDAACVVASHPVPWLAWAALYDEPSDVVAGHADLAHRHPSPAPAAAPAASAWLPDEDLAAFDDRVRSILALIAAGDSYQVNLTFPLRAHVHGEPEDWYHALRRCAHAPFAAYIDTGAGVIVSLSPELFFDRIGDQVVTRPMKGTAPRGRWRAEDEALRQALVSSDKARAENVMIVDLLRNDLGRVATTGSVHVRDLCAAERYPTVWQLTSTIAATVPRQRPLWDVLQALFPCGSVTGAPKLRTMEIIAAHEAAPRGVYTGAIGLIRPGGDAIFSVPIRTPVIDRPSSRATLGVGAGLTADSIAADEYAECLLKAAFARAADPARTAGLFETLRLDEGQYWLWDRHLARLADSADLLDVPYDRAAAVDALVMVAEAHPSGCWRVRLTLSAAGEIGCVAAPHEDSAASWRVALARNAVDARDRRLFHKTLDRSIYAAARRGVDGVDDVLLWNGEGLVTESTVANLVVEIDGARWTPPIEAGLLPGTFRADLLARGDIRERALTTREVRGASRAWLINSLRGWIEMRLV